MQQAMFQCGRSAKSTECGLVTISSAASAISGRRESPPPRALSNCHAVTPLPPPLCVYDLFLWSDLRSLMFTIVVADRPGDLQCRKDQSSVCAAQCPADVVTVFGSPHARLRSR